MKFINLFVVVALLSVGSRGAQGKVAGEVRGRPTTSSGANTNDVTNKALVTKAGGPELMASAALHKWADDYYAWRNENYPVQSSDAGLHTWDNRLTDYSPAKIAERAQHVHALLEKVRAIKADAWPKDERIDWILFRSQLEQVDFGNRILKSTRTNPQVYIGECVSGIFSLLKRNTTRRVTARSRRRRG